MVRHFDPACPKCKQRFHVHHDELRHANIKLLCPYCQTEFFIEESESVIEHDGTITYPAKEASRSR